MDLAQFRQAKRLESPTALDDLIDHVRDEAARTCDHPDISLNETSVLDDGLWQYNGAAGRLNRHSLNQLCARIRLPGGGTLPAGYLARCPSPLAAEHLNHWIRTMPPHEVPHLLVRTRDESIGEPSLIRAVLSNRYAFADHLDLLSALEEALTGKRLGLHGWSLDDEQMTLRLILDSDHPASLDDPIRVGLHVSNSEVGLGRISIRGLITRLVCSNGLVVELEDLGSVNRRHIGKAGESLEEIIHVGLTKVLADTHEAARRFIRLREEPLPDPLEEFLRKLARDKELPDLVAEKALAALAGDRMYDLVNAFTLVAQQFPINERIQIETAMSHFLSN